MASTYNRSSNDYVTQSTVCISKNRINSWLWWCGITLAAGTYLNNNAAQQRIDFHNKSLIIPLGTALLSRPTESTLKHLHILNCPFIHGAAEEMFSSQIKHSHPLLNSKVHILREQIVSLLFRFKQKFLSFNSTNFNLYIASKPEFSQNHTDLLPESWTLQI